MQPIKILTTHLQWRVTDKNIAFYKALANLGDVLVAIPDDESYNQLWMPTLPRSCALEERRAALEAIPAIALVFDACFVNPSETLARDALTSLKIDAFACHCYPNNREHPSVSTLAAFLSRHRIPIISVAAQALVWDDTLEKEEQRGGG